MKRTVNIIFSDLPFLESHQTDSQQFPLIKIDKIFSVLNWRFFTNIEKKRYLSEPDIFKHLSIRANFLKKILSFWIYFYNNNVRVYYIDKIEKRKKITICF